MRIFFNKSNNGTTHLLAEDSKIQMIVDNSEIELQLRLYTNLSPCLLCLSASLFVSPKKK